MMSRARPATCAASASVPDRRWALRVPEEDHDGYARTQRRRPRLDPNSVKTYAIATTNDLQGIYGNYFAMNGGSVLPAPFTTSSTIDGPQNRQTSALRITTLQKAHVIVPAGQTGPNGASDNSETLLSAGRTAAFESGDRQTNSLSQLSSFKTGVMPLPIGSQGPKVPRPQGPKAPRPQGPKAPRPQGPKAPRPQGQDQRLQRAHRRDRRQHPLPAAVLGTRPVACLRTIPADPRQWRLRPAGDQKPRPAVPDVPERQERRHEPVPGGGHRPDGQLPGRDRRGRGPPECHDPTGTDIPGHGPGGRRPRIGQADPGLSDLRLPVR
jgi:hypothetical protein